MIALIQRVRHARVEVAGETIAAIGPGLLALVAVQPDDDAARITRMAERLLAYRVFSDNEGRMNLSLQQIDGALLLVSQFTLAADTRSGLRPGFSGAATPAQGRLGFEALEAAVRQRHAAVQTGRYGADMQVSLLNDGPATFLLNT